MIPEQLLHKEYVMNLIQRVPMLSSEITHNNKDKKIPSFEHVMQTNLKKIGFKESLPIILAEGKKDIWFIEIKNNKTSTTRRACEKLQDAGDYLRNKNKAKRVTGWFIFNKMLDPDTKKVLTKAGHIVTEVEGIKLPVV